MIRLADLSKDERIKKEIKRLNALFKNIGKQSRAIADGLIKRAAYMRVTLEDLEQDIDQNGYVEYFTQSEKTDPYERDRPAVRLYNTMNKNYQTIMKQLKEILPEDKADKSASDDILNFALGAKGGKK